MKLKSIEGVIDNNDFFLLVLFGNFIFSSPILLCFCFTI
jgi:hypothetical protein